MPVDPNKIIAQYQAQVMAAPIGAGDGIDARTREQMRGGRVMQGFGSLVPQAYETGEALRALRPDAEGQDLANQSDQLAEQAIAHVSRMGGAVGPTGLPVPVTPPEGKSFFQHLGDVLNTGPRFLGSALRGYNTALPFESGIGRALYEGGRGALNPDEGTTLAEYGGQEMGRLGGVLGTVGDIALDPLNLVGGPLMRLGVRGLGAGAKLAGATGTLGALGGLALGGGLGVGGALGAAAGAVGGKFLGLAAPRIERGLVAASRFGAEAMIPGFRLGHVGREAAEGLPTALGQEQQAAQAAQAAHGLHESQRAEVEAAKAAHEAATATATATAAAPAQAQAADAAAAVKGTRLRLDRALSRQVNLGLMADRADRVVDAMKAGQVTKEVTELKPALRSALGAYRSSVPRRLEDQIKLAVDEGLPVPLKEASQAIREDEASKLILGHPESGWEGLIHIKDPHTGNPLVLPAFRKVGEGPEAWDLPKGWSVPRADWWRKLARSEDGKQVFAVPSELARELDDLPGFGAPSWLTALEGSHPIAQSIVKGIKAFDAAFNYYWKGLAVGLSPYTAARNALTNPYLMYERFGGPAMATGLVKYSLKAININRGAEGQVVAGGVKLGYDQILKYLREGEGVHRAGAAYGDITREASRLLEIKQATLGQALKSPRLLLGKGIEAARPIQNAIEDHAKTVTFLMAMDHTSGDVKKSLDITRKTLFDYSDLTAFEREGLARVLPFYRFMRKNAEYQVDRLINSPARAALPFKLLRDLPNATLTPEQRARYGSEIPSQHLQERFAVPTGAERGAGFEMLPLPFVPGEEFGLGQIAQEALGGNLPGAGKELTNQFMARGHPLLGVGNAMFGSRESFTDMPFESAPGMPLYTQAAPVARMLHAIPYIGPAISGTHALPRRLDEQGNPEIEQTVRARRLLGTLPLGAGGIAAQLFSPSDTQTRGDALLRTVGFGFTGTTPERTAAAALAKMIDKKQALEQERKKALGLR